MLRKLLKYEIKATARIFLPLYVVLLAFAVIHKMISVLSLNKREAPEVISLVIYIMILVGILIITLIVMIQRFYKNLLSDEGYLMFTLPAKPWKHTLSKLLISMMWIVVSGIVADLSILIISNDKIPPIRNIQNAIDQIVSYFNYYNESSVLFILEILLVCIISLASAVLIVYASIAIGHLFNRHRILFSLGAFIVLSTLSQILLRIANMITIPGPLSLSGNISARDVLHVFEPIIHFAILYDIIFLGLLSAGYFIVTNYILSKRLNLE